MAEPLLAGPGAGDVEKPPFGFVSRFLPDVI